MVLEATMIIIDNSEFMRNGDYPTNRYEAQLDTVDIIFNAKTQSNPENTVGILSMGGDGPNVLSTLTNDIGKIRVGIHDSKIHGKSHLSSGIQVAALALKHRQNKVQSQRIIAFVGSPISETEKDLEKLAKKMKKNNIAVDFINFGEEAVNSSKLEKFINIVNNHDNSHLVNVPSGPKLLSSVVISSAILSSGEDAEGFENDGFGGDGFDFDANVDPDLALALRLSLEEEKARQERDQKQQAEKLETVNEEQDGNAKMDESN
ncbi:proteasome regulatory particle base subunit [Saccharomycopsis crataegensis]|uniref:Proteasome regulatory particle base subunit n=1 Tax=Saccharomycopsis crataegensis TaxID=43959 RepID=A0AAV5QNI1_9ASCO|nr:proteasome regulatory particle base subunit [Saccharomycopsis crataegensis]